MTATSIIDRHDPSAKVLRARLLVAASTSAADVPPGPRTATQHPGVTFGGARGLLANALLLVLAVIVLSRRAISKRSESVKA